MHAPVLGPAHPSSKTGAVIVGATNHRSGQVEDAHLNSYSFDDEFNTFQT